MKIRIKEGLYQQKLVNPREIDYEGKFMDFLTREYPDVKWRICIAEEVYPNGVFFTDNDEDDLPYYPRNWLAIENPCLPEWFYYKEDTRLDPYKFCNTKPESTTLMIVKNTSPAQILETKHEEFWDIIRKNREYESHKDMYIELTMSCNKNEAISWMKTWMLWARAYWYETLNIDWVCKFIAAYDMYKYLSEGR